MIEVIPGMPGNVVALRAKGKVTGKDYESVLIPAVEATVKEYGRIRLLYQIGEEFSGFEVGAMWDDAKVGLRHFAAWEKVAVVTDIDWMRGLARFFSFMILGRVKVFKNDQFFEAKDWVKD